jgi:GGDEF domain-containing protein
MRQGIGCALYEAEAGSLDEVRRCLESWRFACRLAGSGTTAEAVPSPLELLVVELRGGPAGGAAAPLVAAHARAGGATLALCPADDARGFALAAAFGCDDMLAYLFDPIELVRRLQTLASLAGLAVERTQRRQLFAAYNDPQPAPLPATPVPSRLPGVALMGRSEAVQAQLVAALPPASLIYLETPMRLGAALMSGGIDLLLVTQPDLLAATLQAVDDSDAEPPILLAAHAGPPWALELPPQVDLLSLPASMPVARARLALALRTAGLRRWLLSPPLGAAAGLLVDSLTGLYNQGAFLDYLRLGGADRAVIGLEHGRLDWINEQSGYAVGNRTLAALGSGVRRQMRVQNFAAHLGGGRFAVAVATQDAGRLERLCRQLQTGVAGQEPWQILTRAEVLPARGMPAQRLSRLFANARRLRAVA